jgi:hypothetical protein
MVLKASFVSTTTVHHSGWISSTWAIVMTSFAGPAILCVCNTLPRGAS